MEAKRSTGSSPLKAPDKGKRLERATGIEPA